MKKKLLLTLSALSIIVTSNQVNAQHIAEALVEGVLESALETVVEHPKKTLAIAAGTTLLVTAGIYAYRIVRYLKYLNINLRRLRHPSMVTIQEPTIAAEENVLQS
jgi:hypothetical protein